uniref:FAD/NAD(P)-binding domain-containing protein n=1 Tax=Aureoumbra lagunensis TaxID=44058 RepID=A0A7S3NGX0_9STRA|mmetsp:Transcript_20972/g.32165  ORF Transcript_20972/g.32165 Transcript_20972/m.32165 type:complete len:399 (+) Transcript_20972:1344-2540(+)|eukprot:CAMPEP_0197321912 /NCGR_PEP_ID=MMETSP0891-20130614/66989_1 /TAXON_ID=44058 ORGANISM="Aureoumbra lagunensis, Strain CCMP1510" /NCGR_SAMPLE_ID=MMETSP0891 /ASSEMBLY_ACC=CAM_ASM_000534 /LENGTH=398 /DNA_ID=CAMNT_0042814019 /DNA_START=1331 /DNA_END=2527 /DNA_ORIENTATION=-
MSKKNVKEVVILGASFAGLQVASDLAGTVDLKVTVVDPLQYWEFTPSIHTLLGGARSDGETLLTPLNEKLVGKDVSFITGRAMALDEEGNISVLINQSIQKIRYDYLVIATGCGYATPIRPVESKLESRLSSISKCKKKVADSTSILIVGGGAVGVEMAAELAWCGKKVTLATNAHELLLDCPSQTREKAQTWLLTHGVDIFFQTKVQEHAVNTFKLIRGNGADAVTTISQFDSCFWCIGGKPRTEFLANSLIVKLDPRGFVQIDQATRQAAPGIYAIGDVAAKSDAQRLASYAHLEGEFVARAILKHAKSGQLSTDQYIAPPRFVALSLGPRDGAFIYDSYHISMFPGRLVPILKMVIEAWFIRLLPMPYAILKLLPGDVAARFWCKKSKAPSPAVA